MFMLCSLSLSIYIYTPYCEPHPLHPAHAHESACTVVVVEVLSVCREEEIKSLKEQLRSVSGKSAC